LQADIFNLPIERMEADEGPAYGAALLGGVAAGVFRDAGEAASVVQLGNDVTTPDPERTRQYEERYDIFRRLYPALHQRTQSLASINA
jgi:xylulokinase